MIKPEIDLELSINALKVYGIEPNIIKSMLSNLQKVVNKNCNIPHVSNNEVALKAFVGEFVESWEDGNAGDTDLYRKAKRLL